MDDVLKITDWQKVSQLGSGAFGTVSLWKSVVSNEFIAIKKCKLQMASSLTPKQRERWKKEVETMKKIEHKNIVGFKEIPSDLENGLLKNNPTKLPLLSMEYCRKGNLRHFLLKPKNVSGLEEHDVRCILKDIVSGLQHLHNLNITHRDIKPDNIVLQHCKERKEETIYKIIDLGYAKELNDSTVSFVGTLHYLAPEIFEALKYNNSVDYWSLGIMTFEIICGVLPFLPHLSPPLRFSDIKRKGPDDICIYLNYSGQIINSTDLKNEILITKCFKENLEVWLRHVLQFDPIKRGTNFPNNLKVFRYLNEILDKKIIKVFTLEKLGFHSYEIDDSTLVGTLKDWISRDIKIPKTELILLFRKEFFASDGQLVISIHDIDDYVFVINRNCLVSYPLEYKFPKLIREVMRSALTFNHRYLWQLYSQTFYYITIEKITANLFRYGLQYYVGFIKKSTENLRKQHISVSKKLNNLLVRVDCFTTIRKNIVPDKSVYSNGEYNNCLIRNKGLLDKLQENLNYYRDFEIKIDRLFKRLTTLINNWPKIVDLVNDYDLMDHYDRMMNLLEKTERGKNAKLLKSEITDIVSTSIRLKEKLFKNKIIAAFFCAITTVGNSIETVSHWLQDYDKNIQHLSGAYMQNEILYLNIRVGSSKEYYKQQEQLSCDSISDKKSPKSQISEAAKENSSVINEFDKLISDSMLEDMIYSLEKIKF